MKRIEKVESLIGLELIRENGEVITFGIEDIKDITNSRLEGKQYSVINLNNGYSIYHRNTAQCTFYQVFEPIHWIQEEVEEEVVEEVIEEPVANLDPNLLTFDDGEGEDITDFYSKNFNKLITLENEHAMVFGFVEGESVYVPIESKSNTVEFCQIYKYEDVKPIITEETTLEGQLCNLAQNKRKFDNKIYELFYVVKDTAYTFNKGNADLIIKGKYKGEDLIGFVSNDKVIFPIESSTSFFKVMTVLEFDKSYVDSIGYDVLYKRYIKQKSTSGVTDLDYTDVFSYFKY